MISAVMYRDTHPYDAVVLIMTTFPDGYTAYGSGAVVGRNDILTATHVLFDPDHGGAATDISLVLGSAINPRLREPTNADGIVLTNFAYETYGWPQSVFTDSNNNELTYAEAQYDVAVIGVSVDLSLLVEHPFIVAPHYGGNVWAEQVGYPGDYPGMTQGQAWVHQHNSYGILLGYTDEGSDRLGPGSSGGPLYVMKDGQAHLIGVKTSSGADHSIWADVGFTYTQLVERIENNDHLIVTVVPDDSDNPLRYDSFFVLQKDEVMRDYTHTGGAGLDMVAYFVDAFTYGLRDVEVNGSQVTLLINNAGGGVYRHEYQDVERFILNGRGFATDVGPGENAGSAYRVYQAAFNREPDLPGLRYWLEAMDFGDSLVDIAGAFTGTPEYQHFYGANPTPETLVWGHYRNVLGRDPEEGGFNYWVNEMKTGEGFTAAVLLASFAESAENIALVAPKLEDGLWLE